MFIWPILLNHNRWSIWSISSRSLESRESGQLISEILRITYGQNLCWMDSVLKLLHCDFPVFGMPISLLLVWPTFRPDIFVWNYMFILSDTLSDLKSFEFKKRSFSPIPILRMRLFINERQVKTNAVETISWEGVDPNS